MGLVPIMDDGLISSGKTLVPNCFGHFPKCEKFWSKEMCTVLRVGFLEYLCDFTGIDSTFTGIFGTFAEHVCTNR